MSHFESWHNNRKVSREEGRPTRTQHHRFDKARYLRFVGAHMSKRKAGCGSLAGRTAWLSTTMYNAALTGAEGVRVEGTVMQQEN